MADEAVGKQYTSFLEALVNRARSILNDPSVAADRVNDVFTRVIEDPKLIKGSAENYLTTAVTNACIDWNEKEKNETKRLKKVAMYQQLPEQDEMRQEIEALVRALPEDQQAVFTLKTGEKITMEQVARALGIPTSTAKARFRHACETLRGKLLKSQEDLKK